MRQPADTADPIVTLEEFQRMPEEDAYRAELVRGHIVREQLPSARHGQLVVRLGGWIDIFASERGLGLTMSDSGFVLSADPPTVRGPDIAFIALPETPREEDLPVFWRGAPDLAVEVVSPSNTTAGIQEKVLEYLSSGARLVWVVDPETRSVTTYRSRDDIRILTEGDALTGGDVLPGFSVPVARIFALP